MGRGAQSLGHGVKDANPDQREGVASLMELGAKSQEPRDKGEEIGEKDEGPIAVRKTL